MSETPQKEGKPRRRKKKAKPVGYNKIQVPDFQPKTDNQAKYIESIERYPVTLCTGPAGTGKTFLACCIAARKLVQGEIRKILLVRPAVEAGEKLGYLPGDVNEKLHPYLIPLFDALNDMVGSHNTRQFMREGVIEIAPLAFMRGRTLNKAFVILDEAQNTNKSQMKMFLTRMGRDSKFVVNGDITQSDLEGDSGLADAHARLQNVSGVNWVKLDRDDIVRHKVVQGIVDAYEGSAEECERSF